MDDGIDRVVGEQPAHLVPIGEVAGDHLDRRPQAGQFGAQLGRRGPAHQQQPPDAVRGHEVPGQQAAQRPGRAGHQHRPGQCGTGLGRQLAEPRDQDGTIADGLLRLVQAHHVRDGAGVVQVEEDEPAGVLGLRRADQPPHRGVDQVRVGARRVPGHQDQPLVRRVLVRQPVPGDVEDLLQHLAYRRPQVLVRLRAIENGGHRRFPGRRRRLPVHFVQSAAGLAHRAERQGSDRGHRLAVGVRQGDGEGVFTRRCQPDSQCRRIRCHAPHSGPRERDPQATAVEQQRVQRRVEQRRMQGVAVRLGKEVDLGEQLLTASPGCTQSPERGPVLEAGLGQHVVPDVQGDRVFRRPHRLIEPRRRLGRRQRSARVPAPLGVTGRPGVHAHRPAAGAVDRTHQHLRLDNVLCGQFERRFDRQLLDGRALQPGARVGGQFEEAGPGKQDLARHDVVGEPGLRAQRDPAGGQRSGAVGQLDRGRQDRVRRPGRRPGLEPVLAVLEGVGRQVDQPSAGQQGQPVDLDAAHVRLGQRRQEPLESAVIAAQ
ncbi:hypothetical protein Amsp01_040150 [Amycolatopsis sp. NBRC 101858]|nr:hypothetical protein Amsp01_040150 [Amycolatopsis sp. NBRC 101858]